MIQLLGDPLERLDLTCVFISHDLALAEAVARDVTVMRLGSVPRAKTRAG